MAAAVQRQRVLIQAVMELPPSLRRHLTGKKTIEWLVKAIKKKLGLQVSEDTVRHDIRLLRPLFEGSAGWEYTATGPTPEYTGVGRTDTPGTGGR